METFANIKPRSLVTFRIPNGIGRGGVEYKEKSGRAVLCFASHVVVNGGGRYGTPYVVNENNFVRKGK